MAINFPSSPAQGAKFTDPSTGKKYVAAKGGTPAEWVNDN